MHRTANLKCDGRFSFKQQTSAHLDNINVAMPRLQSKESFDKQSFRDRIPFWLCSSQTVGKFACETFDASIDAIGVIAHNTDTVCVCVCVCCVFIKCALRSFCTKSNPFMIFFLLCLTSTRNSCSVENHDLLMALCARFLYLPAIKV